MSGPDYVFLFESVPSPGEWSEHGACRTADPDLFFPERGERVTAAKAICARCPVLEECREYALSAGWMLQGVWGGTSVEERRHLRVVAA